MKKSIFDFFKKEENTKDLFSELTTVDGLVLQYEGELVADTGNNDGTKLFVVDDQGNQIPAPEGDYQVDYEGILWAIKVDVNGVLVEKVEVNAEEPMSEETQNETTNELMSKEEFDAIIQKVIVDTDSRLTQLEQKFNDFLNSKESKFKDERKKVELSKELTVKEILTNKK